MNILVTGAWGQAKDNMEELNKKHNAIFMQMESEELPCEYDWVEGVICNGLFLHHPIDKFKNLKYIQLTSAGYDRINMNYVKEHNIEIHNARGVYSIPMAEFAISGVLQLYKQSRFFYENQLEKKWEKNRQLIELFGKTVCIVGCGSVGIECAKRFKAFGCTVIGVDICKIDSEYFDRVVLINQLKKEICGSDIVVTTLPLMESTKHIINREVFGAMKQDSVIVNIARGAIVDTDALEHALTSKLRGAVLDVFEEEPLDKNNFLWDMKNVILTPHNSFLGDGNDNRLEKVILSNIRSK